MKLNWFGLVYYGSFAVSVIAVVGLIIWGIYEAYKAIRNKLLRYEELPELVKVGRKKHEDAYTTFIPMTISTGKSTITTMTPTPHDEEFNVYLIYEGKEHCFNNKDMFESLKVGDTVKVTVHKGYNTIGKLKNTYLTID